MKRSDFDYPLPKEMIAQSPAEPRSSSKLMVLNGDDIEHKKFYEIVEYFRKGDVLVINDTKVIPARLVGKKSSGGKIDLLLVKRDGEEGLCLIKGKKIRTGTKLVFGELTGTVTGLENDKFRVRFGGGLEEMLEKIGRAPTPPYIKKEVDREKYQTVYARKPGSIAAPTAGFHFTPELLSEIEKKGVKIARVMLHVGLGTFSPVKLEDLQKHKMEAEYFEIDKENADIINGAKRLIVCGTTSVKAIESANDGGGVNACSGWSELFIYPPYKFKTKIDAMITNFHLPKSTLLMLVCAYAGRDRILGAYKIAVEKGYRFYSFGDAMLILNREM